MNTMRQKIEMNVIENMSISKLLSTNIQLELYVHKTTSMRE